MSNPRTEKLAGFVEWTRAHIRGDEKGEAQIYLDRLFQAFGHGGLLEVGTAPDPGGWPRDRAQGRGRPCSLGGFPTASSDQTLLDR